MTRTPSLWESERLTLEHAIALTRESLQSYGSGYRHWAVAYSGGKDSTATVTLVCHLIAAGFLPPPDSLTVLYADTRMELPPLHACAMTILGELRQRGIHTRVVLPALDDRFFVYLFGRGVPAPKNRFKLCRISSPVKKIEMAMPSKATPIKKRIEMMCDVQWERYPILATFPLARTWLQIQANLCEDRTAEAYGRGLEDFLAFCTHCGIDPETATREHLAHYVHDLVTRPNKRHTRVNLTGKLANATIQQRLTAVRLFYDYLMEEQVRVNNPVGRGRYTPGKAFGGQRDRGLLPRFEKLPWVPSDEQWQAILMAAKQESLRNRIMLALSYEAALRREELCLLETGDIDPAHRTIRIRAETSKGRRERVVPYSESTGALYVTYLRHRRELSRERGPLFLSESRRNYAQPLSIWTWSKVMEAVAERAGVPQFTTHTPRHLRLTDLARANWDLHEIATFAGHRSLQSTMRYIHLSGRDLAEKLERGMNAIHAWRIAALSEVLQ